MFLDLLVCRLPMHRNLERQMSALHGEANETGVNRIWYLTLIGAEADPPATHNIPILLFGVG